LACLPISYFGLLTTFCCWIVSQPTSLPSKTLNRNSSRWLLNDSTSCSIFLPRRKWYVIKDVHRGWGRGGGLRGYDIVPQANFQKTFIWKCNKSCKRIKPKIVDHFWRFCPKSMDPLPPRDFGKNFLYPTHPWISHRKPRLWESSHYFQNI
jgi:hypothetical protein